MSTEKNSAGVREARRRLAAQIRTDFTFDWPAPSKRSDTDDDIRGSCSRDGTDEVVSHSPSTRVNHAREIWSQALDWRERTYASSDPSSGSEGDVPAASPSEPMSPRQQYMHFSRFEQPKQKSQPPPREKTRRSSSAMSIDPAPVDVERKKKMRKRRRQQRLEEEMGWNEGMAHWIAQRDAWCCARLEPREHSVHEDAEEAEDADTHATSEASDLAPEPAASEDIADVKSWPSTDGSSSKADDGLSEQPSNERWSNPSVPASSVTSASQHSVNLPSTSTTAVTPARAAARPSSYNTLLPIPPPLLSPDDPTRASITQNIYPSIYSKIVTQSLTPSVPINLSHMVNALVQGWKNDGEWPPKAGPEKVGVDSKGRPIIVNSNQPGLVHGDSVARSRSSANGTGGGKRRLLERRRGANANGDKRLSLGGLGGSGGHNWGRIWKDKLSGSHDHTSPPAPYITSPGGPKEIGSHIFGHGHNSRDSHSHEQQLTSGSKAESGQESPGFRKNVAAKVGRVLRLSIGGSEKMSTDSSPESAAGVKAVKS